MSRKNRRNYNNKQDAVDKKNQTACGTGKVEKSVEEAYNDPYWYVTNPQMLKDVASFSYGSPIGTRITLSSSAEDPILNNFSIPGIMAIKTMPGIGWSDNVNSPVNLAARNLYSWVRHVNSGSRNYEPADLMMYLVGMDSAYMYWGYLVRAYGVLQLYNPMNRYYPKALVEAMGIDFDDVNGNINDFRAYINQYSYKIAQCAVPSGMSYFKRHFWLYSNLYTDQALAKAQTYMYVPDGFHLYDELNGPGRLVYKKFYDKDALKTFKDLRNWGESLLLNLTLSEDVGIMSGDIIKAFGTDILHVQTIPENYYVLPVYNQEVLMQMQNITALPYDPKPDTANITQDVDKQMIEWKPTFVIPRDKFDLDGYTADKLITIPLDNVSPEASMVATRLSVIYDEISSEDPENAEIRPNSVGSEICTGFHITGSSGLGPLWNFGQTAVMGTVMTMSAESLTYITFVSTFDYHPSVYFSMKGSLVTGMNNTAYLAEIGNYRAMSRTDLANMNEMAVLAMFKAPQIAG